MARSSRTLRKSPGFDIAFATRPQNTVAGDYYDALFATALAGNATGTLGRY